MMKSNLSVRDDFKGKVCRRNAAVAAASARHARVLTGAGNLENGP